MLVIFQGIFSEQKEYKAKKLLMILTTIIFQLYHWMFFLTFLQVSFEFLFQQNTTGGAAYQYLSIFNLLFTILIGLVNQRFETSYLFKITDFLERRPSFYFYAGFVCKIVVIFIFTLKIQTDINIWAHLFLSGLLILEAVEKFSFINFAMMQVYSAFCCIYAYLIVAYILLYYLNQYQIKTFDLAFSLCICLPILIKISLNIYEYIHQKCLLLDLEKISNVTLLDQSIRVLYYNLKHCKNNQHASLQVESWIFDHTSNCLDPTCLCKPFLKKNPNFENSIALKKKLTKLIIGKTLEKACKSLKGQNNTYLHFIYLTFLLQILKVPTKTFSESLKLGEKSKKFGLGDRVFTEIFIEQASTFFEKNLAQNKLKNQKLDFMKLIRFEEKSLKLYEDLVKVLLEYIEFYGMMSHSFIELNTLEAKINFLIQSRAIIDINLNQLVRMHPKSMILQEISMIFYFYLFPINQLEHKNKDLMRIREELKKSTINFELFDPEAAVVSITLLKQHGLIRSHSRNFSKLMKYDTLINENVSRIMPRMFSDVHTQILERFIEEGRYSLTKEEDRIFFALDKQNFIFPVRLRMKIDVFGLDDFGATGFMVPINKKFSYAIANLEGRTLNISQRLYEKAFFRLLPEVSWKHLYRINLGICLPSLLFQFFGVSEDKMYEDYFDTIFIAPKNFNSEEAKLFTADFGESTERSVFSMDFNRDTEKSFHSLVSRASRRGKREKTMIMEKLVALKAVSASNLRLYSAKVKATVFKYSPNNLKFIIIEMQAFSGIHRNKQKIYDKYLLKLIQSYEESERADIKLFTTTQISSLGLFAEQGFIFRDSVDSIRSSMIDDKEKESQRNLTGSNKRLSEYLVPDEKDNLGHTLESQSISNSHEPEERNLKSKDIVASPKDVEIPSKSKNQDKSGKDEKTTEEDILPKLLDNLRDKQAHTKTKDNPTSYDFISSAAHAINFKQRMVPYNKDLYFSNPPMLKRGVPEPNLKPISEDILGINPEPNKKPSEMEFLSQINEESKIKSSENEEKEVSDEFVIIEDKEDKDDKGEKKKNETPTPNPNKEPSLKKQKAVEKNVDQTPKEQEIEFEKRNVDNNDDGHGGRPKTEKSEKKGVKKKEKNKLKAILARDEKKMKIVESIATSSENSSTKVVQKNFLHLIKSKSFPFSLKVISFLGYLGFLGLAVTFSVLYSLLYQSFQDLNENLINVMFGHHFARPLGFIIKGIEQKVLLENYFYANNNRAASYDDVQLLAESLGDYEYSYLQLINMNVKYEYQTVFMNAQMSLKLYNLDQSPTEINLVLVHAFGLFTEHMRMCLQQDGPTLVERGNDAYYFLYQNAIELMNQMLLINLSTQQEVNSQMDKINTMIILFLVLAELVVFFISMIILPIFVQANKRKEEALVLFCTFQQDVLISKISMYTTIYNDLIGKINEISDQYSKTLNEVSFINLIKKQRKKISTSQHSKLKVNFIRVFIIILASFIVISIYPIVNFILTNNFLVSFSYNVKENIVFGKLSSSFSLFYAINYFNINYQFYVHQQGLPLLNQTITQSWTLNSQIIDDILNYASYDLDLLISSPYVTATHQNFLTRLKGDNLCDLISLSPEKHKNCSGIYKGQMKLGLVNVLKAVANDFKEIYGIVEKNPNNKQKIEQWLGQNNFFDLDLVLEYMQPITKLIIDNSIDNFQNFLNLQIALVTGLFIFGVMVLVLIGGFGFLKLILYLNELLYNARFLLSVLPIDLIQENSYLMSHLAKEFKKMKF